MLQGSLDTFGLADVLTLLATTGKTGGLHVEGDRGTASLWFEAGEVVGARAAGVAPDDGASDVLFEVLRYGRGQFSFSTGEASPEPGPPLAVIALLGAANELLGEWRDLTAVVPSLAHVVALVPDLVDDQVTLDRDQWRTVLAVGAGCTVAQLGGALDLGEVPVLRRVCELLDRGVVEVLAPEVPLCAPPAEVPVPRRAAVVAPAREIDPPAIQDVFAWYGGRPDRRASAPVVADAPPEPSHQRRPVVLDQLGGLSPRAAHDLTEVARGGGDDSVLMAFLRGDG